METGQHNIQREAKVERCQVKLDSREAFDEIQYSFLLHEGTSPLLGIVHPIHGRNIGNMEPHSARKRTRVVHDGRPVPAAFVVSLKRGRSSIGNYDCGVSVIRQSYFLEGGTEYTHNPRQYRGQ